MTEPKSMMHFFADQLKLANDNLMIVQIGLESYASATEADPSVIVHAIEMCLRQYETLYDEMVACDPSNQEKVTA